jgi:hypothetical protein
MKKYLELLINLQWRLNNYKTAICDFVMTQYEFQTALPI